MDEKSMNSNKFNKTDISNIKKIQKLYDNLTYFDTYAGSFILFIIITIVLFIIVSYCYVSSHISNIRKNWIAERCKPYIIPFAGMINKPENMTAEEYTDQNFNYCAQSILKVVTGFAVEPFEFISAAIVTTANLIVEGLQGIREAIYDYRENLIKIAEKILNQIMNLTTSLQVIIVEFGDVIARVQGTMIAGLYTTIGTFMTFQVFLDIVAYGCAVTMIIISVVMVVMVPMIISFYLAIVTIPLAMTLTEIFLSFLVLYIGLMIPLGVTLGILEDDLGATIDWQLPPPPPAPPSAPSSCFDKNTMIEMNDGTKKRIFDIQVGDRLINNNMVTAKLELSASDSQMYILNDITVSGTHSIKINNKWIKINCYNEAKKINNYTEKYIYCLNTEQKEILINGCVFYDWDEINEDDIETIKIIHNTNKYNTNKERINNDNRDQFEYKNIHKYFDGGFIGDTKIKLINGCVKDMRDIEIDDILEKGEKVYGVVEIDGKQLSNQYIYNLGNYNREIIGGPNLNLCDINVKFTTTLNLNGSNSNLEFNGKQDKLYHLLTDKKTFYVNGLRFYDYNTSIEILLEKNKGKILSMKYV
jgi:hypothetical protein